LDAKGIAFHPRFPLREKSEQFKEKEKEKKERDDIMHMGAEDGGPSLTGRKRQTYTRP
jgi:hypothetical protein